jgi:FeS assembly SUF system protein
MEAPPRRFPLDTLEPAPSSAAAPPPPQQPATDQPSVQLDAEQIQALEDTIIAVLCTCFDPEIPVNIYDMGLIYGIDIQPTGAVHVRMTLTSPACPVAGSLPPEVRAKIQAIPGVTAAKVDVVWEPPWEKERMSEAAKLQLGIDDW